VAELREAWAQFEAAMEARNAAISAESGGKSYPWPALDIAADRVRAVIEGAKK